jgi:hypothetical protein
MILDIAILAFATGVGILAVLVWVTHRDMEKLRQDLRTLVNEMRADRVLMRQAIVSIENVVSACHRLVEAVVALADSHPPSTGPAE